MHKNDKLIIMGDFCARVGSEERIDYSVMGTYGVGQRKNRGEQLLDLCSAMQIICTYPTQNLTGQAIKMLDMGIP